MAEKGLVEWWAAWRKRVFLFAIGSLLLFCPFELEAISPFQGGDRVLDSLSAEEKADLCRRVIAASGKKVFENSEIKKAEAHADNGSRGLLREIYKSIAGEVTIDAISRDVYKQLKDHPDFNVALKEAIRRNLEEIQLRAKYVENVERVLGERFCRLNRHRLLRRVIEAARQELRIDYEELRFEVERLLATKWGGRSVVSRRAAKSLENKMDYFEALLVNSVLWKEGLIREPIAKEMTRERMIRESVGISNELVMAVVLGRSLWIDDAEVVFALIGPEGRILSGMWDYVCRTFGARGRRIYIEVKTGMPERFSGSTEITRPAQEFVAGKISLLDYLGRVSHLSKQDSTIVDEMVRRERQMIRYSLFSRNEAVKGDIVLYIYPYPPGDDLKKLHAKLRVGWITRGRDLEQILQDINW